MSTISNGQYDTNIDMVAEGSYFLEDDTTFLDFENTEHEVKMRVGINNDTVTVSRFGDEVYTMVLQKDIKTNFLIHTQNGDLPVSILTHDITLTTTDEEINLKLDYTLQFDFDSEPNHNVLELKCIKH